MRQELISIITPMYNSEKFIVETYKSIESQTYSNWEWIVIDDNSSDESVNIIIELMKKDLRIKLIKNSKNLLAAKSRNKGIDSANGVYITFIDSDDLWDKNFLEKQVYKLKEKKQNIIFSSYRRISEDGNKSYGNYIVPSKVCFEDLLKTNYMSCLTVIYKKNKFQNIRFNEKLKMHEDYMMWLELLRLEKEIYTNQEILATYRIRKKSTSSNKLKNLVYMFYLFNKINKISILKTIYFLSYYVYFGLKKHNYKR